MVSVLWVALAWSALFPGLQEGWRDTHRVHLRNGQFLDGRLEQIADKEVLFRWSPSALLRIRRMEIDRIEEIKIRPLRSLPKPVPLPEVIGPPPVEGGKPEPGEKPPEIRSELAAAIDVITASLVEATESKRVMLIKRLRSYGLEGARHLISQLPKYEPTRASAALLALGSMKDLQIDRDLQELLLAEMPLLRQEACLLLAAREASGAVPSLVGLIADPVPGVRVAAAEAVGRLGDQGRLGLVAEACLDREKTVRAMALHFARTLAVRTDSELELVRLWLAMVPRAGAGAKADLAVAIGRLAGTHKNPEVPAAEMVQALVELLGDRVEAVRAAAAGGIGEARSAGAAASSDLLAALENERASSVSAALCEALGNVVAQSAVDPLIAKLETGDDVVKDAAGRALRKITRQPFDLDPEKWREWREMSK